MIAESQGWNESDCLWIGREMNTQTIVAYIDGIA